MSQSDQDQSQPATPHKLQKAREKGQIAKSADIAGAAVFIVAMIYLSGLGLATWKAQFEFDRALLLAAGGGQGGTDALWTLCRRMFSESLVLAAPLFATIVLTAVAANVGQSGVLFTFHPIKPDFERLSPMAGWKRVASMRSLFLAGRAVAKLVLLSAVVYFALQALTPEFFRLASLSPFGVLRALLDDLASLGMKVAAALAVVALIDLIYTRREFAKQMRMSHREIKDEHKNREGDPRIRGRLRELRRDMLKKSQALQQTRTANVLITNPTHVAIALRYVHGEMASPLLVAKGKGFMAAAMRSIAARHSIPVVHSPALARALYAELPLDQYVPPKYFSQVARIIVWVFARRDALRRSNVERGSGQSGVSRNVPPVEILQGAR